MFELKNSVPNSESLVPAPAPAPSFVEDRKQRRMMVIALALLLVALGFVLYRDRDFWFPETQEAEDQPQSQPQQTSPAATNPAPVTANKSHQKSKRGKPLAKASAPVKSDAENSNAPSSSAPDSTAPPMSATATRTVLPPLEVEVVAGDVHRTLHPGTTSVRVDLQPSSPAQPVAVPSAAPAETAASVTSSAAEHVQMSADTAEVVSRPVKPDYPLLARQMKVQGSVILQALIGRDGLIQGLHVLSGPPILASAAQEAVKQWHFKPHYQGADAVETQAKITVNFTISTN
jgi:TonB family protein